MVRSNKARLYVVLYARGQKGAEPERRFHWALAWGPKEEKKDRTGRLWHVKDTYRADLTLGTWWLETKTIVSGMVEGTSLGRVMVGKILDVDRMERVLRDLPLKQGDPKWTCRSWICDALSALADSGAIGTSVDLKDWSEIEVTCRRFANGKVEQGRFRAGTRANVSVLPTYDMLQEKETVP